MPDLKTITEQPTARAALEALVGQTDWVRQVRAMIAAVAPYASSVMVTGASGTGKELIARAIHALSPRAAGRFVPVDCASITGTLFASHMFGHVKGAFTGATHDAIGCFRAAEGGTIFLDEIGELEPELQAKLLRVLQERRVVPVGSHDGIPVDVRVVAATNRDLRREVAEGRFREDLYYRLNVIAIQTAPLRERPADIRLLASHFLTKLAVENGMPLKRLSTAALERLQQYSWPGNVRELENALERAILLSEGDVIDAAVLPCQDVPPAPQPLRVALAQTPDDGPVRVCLEHRAPQDGHWLTAEEVECEHIRRTLEYTNFNQSAAARLLDIDRHQLRRRMARYDLELPAAKPGRPRLSDRAA